MIVKLVAVASLLTGSGYLLDWPLPNKGVCWIKECCHRNDGTGYIFYDRGAETLLQDLESKVYGQPLITKPIYRSLKAHLLNENPPRPLVMYFSGWTGTGKTFVAQLIAKNLFLKGFSSNYVKYISSSYHFPMKIESNTEIAKQRQRLLEMITNTIRKCDRSLIILDELDKLPLGVVDALQPLVDYVNDIDGVRYNKAIFIFLSNTGAESLNMLSYKMFREAKERKDLSSKDIEEVLILDSFNEPAGLGRSSLLKRHSIGVFVPFLPLERQHVKACIEDEFRKRVNISPTERENLLEEIADEMTFFPNDTHLYSKSGCKGVHEKVTNHLGPAVYFDDGEERSRRKKIEL